MSVKYSHKRTLKHNSKSKVYIGHNIDNELAVVKKTTMNTHTFNEIEILSKLNKRSILINNDERNELVQQYLGYDIIGQHIFIYSKYLGDGSFPLSNIPQLKKTLDRSMYNELFLNIFNGIKFIHDCGICHLDIKPHNIILTIKSSTIKSSTINNKNDGNNRNDIPVPVIIDFELSKPMGTTLKSIGTKDYMSPELLSPKTDEIIVANDKIDIYALGVTINYIKNDGSQNLLYNADRGDDQIVSLCTNINPNDRPSIDELIAKYI